MSRHIFHTVHNGRPIEVTAGWDRPLQGFFMTVLYLENTDVEYEYLFNNLDTANPHPKTFGHFIAKLDLLDIDIPEAMQDDIIEDGRVNMGNKMRNWNK